MHWETNPDAGCGSWCPAYDLLLDVYARGFDRRHSGDILHDSCIREHYIDDLGLLATEIVMRIWRHLKGERKYSEAFYPWTQHPVSSPTSFLIS